MSGFTGVTARVEKVGKTFVATTVESGKDVTEDITPITRSKAYREDRLLGEFITATGKVQWRLTGSVTKKQTATITTDTTTNEEATAMDAMFNLTSLNIDSQEELIKFLHEKALKYRPEGLVISDLKWKFLMRNVLRGENLLMTGPSGCGKTLAAQSVADAFPNRKYFYFNLGATQDPRSTLIGNTHFNQETGTFFSESYFVQAIKTPGAIVLLDEISRAHPEAWNILMTVLDRKQRYLRLDEHEDSPTVKVASGVTFVATANVGSEYTSTRTMDRALKDRFVTVEMEPLNMEQEFGLLKFLYPSVPEKQLKAVAEISNHTREQMKVEAAKLSNMISTRASVQIAGLLEDGFTLQEAAEVAVYPFFDADGGMDSERTYMKQVVQKYLPVEETDNKDELFDGITDSLSDKIPF